MKSKRAKKIVLGREVRRRLLKALGRGFEDATDTELLDRVQDVREDLQRMDKAVEELHAANAKAQRLLLTAAESTSRKAPRFLPGDVCLDGNEVFLVLNGLRAPSGHAIYAGIDCVGDLSCQTEAGLRPHDPPLNIFKGLTDLFGRDAVLRS